MDKVKDKKIRKVYLQGIIKMVGKNKEEKN
jgi:hypothetical protein